MARFDKDFLRTNSVPAPSAQSLPSATVDNPLTARRASIITKLQNLTNIDLTLRAFLVFFFQYGLRVSELCNISPKDIDVSGLVFIRGLKGSSDRFLQASFDVDRIISFRSSAHHFGYYYNRFFIYRLFKRLNISLYKVGSSKAAVTHAGRHLFADLAANYSSDFSGVADALGQKNSSSALYYISSYYYKYDSDGNVIKIPVWSKKKGGIIKQGIMSNSVPNFGANVYSDKKGILKVKK